MGTTRSIDLKMKGKKVSGDVFHVWYSLRRSMRRSMRGSNQGSMQGSDRRRYEDRSNKNTK